MATTESTKDFMDDFDSIVGFPLDNEQIQMCRTGGHAIVASDKGEVQVSIYRTGRAYGWWTLRKTSDGNEVRVEHCLPTGYGMDGMFDTLVPHKAWKVAVDDWRVFFEYCVGKKIAGEVAPHIQGAENAPIVPFPQR